MSFTPVFQIVPGVQSYDWGKIGKSSLTAQFAEVCVDGFETDETKPYAELWMGTHPTVPSYLLSSPTTTLASLITSSPTQYLGSEIVSKFPKASSGQLPFLFKVLSIGKALSIQAHPDKKLAEKLFKERGDVYKDDNHKPEMAIALTPFRGFCGFLPLPLLLLFLLSIPELRALIGESAITTLATSISHPVLPATADFSALLAEATAASVKGQNQPRTQGEFDTTPAQKDALKGIFEILMSSSSTTVASTLHALLTRYAAPSGAASCATDLERALIPLVQQLDKEYPDDVGVLCCFVLNVVQLEVGESMFLGADEPHAYIEGDIIECMATSDNVVRAGLTPKLRDVPTLISMLTYTSAPSHAQLLQPTPFQHSLAPSPKSMLYDPPIEEFSVVRLALGAEESEAHGKVAGPSLVIVTEGEGAISFGKGGEEAVKRGQVWFVAEGTEVDWKAGGEGLVVFRAYVEA